MAIVAVLLFHLDPDWLPGGFLGVDVFFVISGFLITTLLVREREGTGRIDLPAFWTRRARRLLPALLVVVPACILIARTVEADLLVGIRRQALGALTFSTNWLEIAQGSDYFHATSPQLFMNFWSLAVEEQFYLFWPLVTVALLAVHRRLGLRWGVIAGVVLGFGVISATLMAVRYDPADVTRVYYGTDTHLVGLMLGAALALAWAGPSRAGTTTPRWHAWRRGIVLGSLVTLGALLVLAGEGSSWTFRIGIPAASLATALLILAAVERPGALRSTLELAPLTWIGRRSYGLYLWHWPVILVIDQDLPTAPGSGQYVWTRLWAVLVTVALADLSYRFVETPVRQLGFAGAARAVGRRALSAAPRARHIAVGASVAATVALLAVLLTAPDKTSTQATLEANAAEAAAPRQTEEAPAKGDEADFTMPRGSEIDVFGDSMVVGSVHALRYYFPGIQIDAKSNRRWSDGTERVAAAGDSLRRAVVLAYGTNAGTDEEAVEALLEEIGPERMVVLVNLHAERLSRVEGDNETLHAIAEQHPNVVVADWHGAVSDDPDQLQADGIHPSLTGAHLYAKVIRAAFAELSESRTGTPVELEELPVP
ncbi:acyltransferase family protein [Marihabitans asiaticum]